MPTKTIDAVDPIIMRLRVVAEFSPDLVEMARVYEILLPIVRDADVHPSIISLTLEQVRAKLESGLPLLYKTEISWDDQAAVDLMMRLAQGLETMRVETKSAHKFPWLRNPQSNEPTPSPESLRRAQAAGQIRLALEDGKITGDDLLCAMMSDQDHLTDLAEYCQLDPNLLQTLAQHTFKPALRTWRRQLEPLAQGIDWQREYCWVCGSPAMLGELRDNGQSKYLRCGQCGADWSGLRMQCVYCGNQAQDTFGYLYPENQRDTRSVRIEACDQCGGYLKVISTFSPTAVDLLSVEDLATLHLDFIAQQRGYARTKLR